MSDSEELDIGDGESPDASSAPKKKGGLAALLPTILKFAAIGIGAVIFIVTVSFFTVKVTQNSGTPQTSTDPASPYLGKRPIYSYYTDLGSITTKTKDAINHSVTVVMNIGYDQNDLAAASELSLRKNELRDFVRQYFTGKYASELQPENEMRLKQDIMETLNQRYLDTGKVRSILFDRLDVMEVF